MQIPLWPQRQPVDTRIVGGTPRVSRNVNRPTLTRHGDGTGPAVVILPGGAFHLLSLDNEGHDLAPLLVAQGMTAYVLEYTLLPTPEDEDGFLALIGGLLTQPAVFSEVLVAHRPVFRADTQRALELVRHHARVAMVGFSAGGIALADTLAGPVALRPDAGACLYAPFAVPGTAPADAPPLFLMAACDDPFGVTGPLDMQQSWTAAGRPVDTHLFSEGGHGFGMTRQGLPVDSWPDLLVAWLVQQGFGPERG